MMNTNNQSATIDLSRFKERIKDFAKAYDVATGVKFNYNVLTVGGKYLTSDGTEEIISRRPAASRRECFVVRLCPDSYRDLVVTSVSKKFRALNEHEVTMLSKQRHKRIVEEKKKINILMPKYKLSNHKKVTNVTRKRLIEGLHP